MSLFVEADIKRAADGAGEADGFTIGAPVTLDTGDLLCHAVYHFPAAVFAGDYAKTAAVAEFHSEYRVYRHGGLPLVTR
jgi:hypothetical protein